MFAPTGWDAGLDERQLEAVTHGDEPLVILAGAGTGKTRTLTSRVARLLERGTPPERILLLTFTRRAADDMLTRAAAMVGHNGDARHLRGGTFHAVAHRFIAGHAEHLGLSSGFTVLDPSDAADLMDLLRDEEGLAGGEVRGPRPSTLVDIYSRCVNTRRLVGDVVTTDFPWCAPHTEAIASLCKAYVARKRSHDQLDFDDLLLYWRAALADRHLGQHMAAMFDHVLVDEYQDVNDLQVDIVHCLCPGGTGLTAVGDDAQAVYGFRGADSRHLQDLAASLPGAAIIRLERNFRSLQPILDVANDVRPSGSGERLDLRACRVGGRRPALVRCHDTPGEARAVAERILVLHNEGLALRDQAVLVRAAHHSDLIEVELTARRVPYRKYGGLRFVEASHVKDYVAAVRLLDNPADEIAWFRILRMHDGIGPARARKLLSALHPRDPSAVHAWAGAVALAPPKTRTALARSFEAITSARLLADGRGRPQAVLQALRPLVLDRYTNPAARLEDLERLAAAAEATDDLSAWLAEVTLDPPASCGDLAGPPVLDEDYLTISTVHSAKGLEWPTVHLPHLVDGAFPSDMALGSSAGLAEEHRLFYVAVTRARDRLFLYVPLRMPHHRRGRDDRHSLAPASRFLTDTVLRHLDVEELTPVRPRVSAPLVGAPVSVCLDELWQSDAP